MILKKTYRFTLAEMLIVLMLIGIVAGAISINLRKALHTQRFWSEVAKFTNHLQLAQDLMLIAEADIHFKIEANDQEKMIKYWIETDKLFSKAFDSFIKKPYVLKTVHHISYPNSKEGLIDLKFLSKGSTLSSGNVQLSANLSKKEALIANITLSGYPGPISYAQEKKQENEKSSQQDAHLTESVIQEILTVQNEKKQQKTP
ncbi:MAG TPA: prepilin-type N-terminal cleavage/methylation domain-containing protein [Parachlamydiaceae bacterium]|nr:prepilin-type N-terminal cleavage/methylation domain-containing protein [Parachlamydiaceae bacterium]